MVNYLCLAHPSDTRLLLLAHPVFPMEHLMLTKILSILSSKPSPTMLTVMLPLVGLSISFLHGKFWSLVQLLLSFSVTATSSSFVRLVAQSFGFPLPLSSLVLLLVVCGPTSSRDTNTSLLKPMIFSSTSPGPHTACGALLHFQLSSCSAVTTLSRLVLLSLRPRLNISRPICTSLPFLLLASLLLVFGSVFGSVALSTSSQLEILNLDVPLSNS